MLNGQCTACKIVVWWRIRQGTAVGHAAWVNKEVRSQRFGRFEHGSDSCGGGFAAKGIYRQNGPYQTQLKSGPAQFFYGSVDKTARDEFGTTDHMHH